MTLLRGDCLVLLREMPNNSVDSIVTDPPYGLEFMGKDWDAPWKSDRRQTFDGTLTDARENPYGRSKVRNGMGASYGADKRAGQAFQAWFEEIAVECLRVLKPGGHLLAFGGSRTYHRLACAVEDAGFEIRDQIQWIYGSGFPKSLNLPGGLGTALKPAHEPIVLARKHLIGTVANNVLTYGTGALNIDASRIESTDSQLAEKYASVRNAGPRNNAVYGGDLRDRSEGNVEPHALGRFPANVIHDGSDEVLAGFPGEDDTSAARFFYCAKASKSERNAGLEGLPVLTGGEATDRVDGSDGPTTPRAGAGRTGGSRNHHPTVKPLALMRYLVKMVTPPNGTVLDPFLGSGTTAVAAILEGFEWVGCEMTEDYWPIIEARVAWAHEQEIPRTFALAYLPSNSSKEQS